MIVLGLLELTLLSGWTVRIQQPATSNQQPAMSVLWMVRIRNTQSMQNRNMEYRRQKVA